MTDKIIPIFNPITDTQVADHYSIADVLEAIQAGHGSKETIQKIRSSNDGDEQKRLKLSLPAFMPSVYVERFTKLDNNQSCESTGIVQFDIDGLSFDDAKRLREQVSKIPEVVFAFISPRYGLKFGVMTDFQSVSGTHLKKEFQFVFDLTAKYIEHKVGTIEFDRATRSIAQKCYFSYDPDCYFQPNPIIFKCKDQAQRNRIECEIEANTIENSPIDTSVEQVQELLAVIPRDYRYADRFKINYAVISALGSAAKSLLLQHWDTNDRSKLESQIDSQLDYQNSGSGITIRTLYREASIHGWAPKPATNISAVPTDEPPTFGGQRFNINDAQKMLENSITDFFVNGRSKIINYEAGGGKTEHVINAVCDALVENRFQRIALLVPSHELASEIEARIRNKVSRLKERASAFRDKMKVLNRVSIQQIHGRTAENCRHPLQLKNLESDLPQAELVRIQFFKQNTASFCFSCEFRQDCRYINQFNDVFTNIRIYTHAELFNQTGLWNNGQNHDGQPRGGDWVPDYIIVDEDVVGLAVQDDSVVSTSYGDCDSSKAGLLIKEIIHESEDLTLEQIIAKKAEQLASIHKEQQKRLRSWRTEYPNPSVVDINSMDAVKKLQLRDTNKPKTFYIIEKLHQYSLALQLADDPDDLKEDAFFVDNNILTYAGRKSIKAEFENAPILLLDANADESIAKSVFDHEFDFEQISIELNENVRVSQFENQSFSKSQICKPELQKKIEKFIISRSQGKSFGIITYKSLKKSMDLHITAIPNFAEWLSENLSADEYGYFGNIRGLDKFKNLDQLYVIGRHMIPSHALELKYRQIFGGIRKGSEKPLFQLANSTSVFRMSSDPNMAIPQQTYIDARVESVIRFINLSETYQAAHRLRLIHVDKPKELFLLTNQVLNITVDELLNAREVFGYESSIRNTKVDEIVRAIKAQGFLWDKNAAIADATSLSTADVNNLRRKDLAKMILDADDTIEYEVIEGKDEKYRDVTRNVFCYKGSTIDMDELNAHLKLRGRP